MPKTRRFSRHTCLLAVGLLALTACGGTSEDSGTGLELDGASLLFSRDQGSSDLPFEQAVRATVTAPDAARIVVGVPRGASVPAWLSVRLSGADTDWSVYVGITAEYVDPGRHAATLRVAIQRADGSVIAWRDLKVTYEVSPGILTHHRDLWFEGFCPAPAPTDLWIGGTRGLEFTVSADRPWVRLPTPGGVTPAFVPVGVDHGGLAGGDHLATLTVSSGPHQATVSVSYSFAIPPLTMDPDWAVVLQAQAGGPPVEAFRSLALSTQCWKPHPVAVTAAPAWLGVTLDPTIVGTTSSLARFVFDPTGLATGTYEGAVEFTATVEGHAVVRSVPVSATVGLP